MEKENREKTKKVREKTLAFSFMPPRGCPKNGFHFLEAAFVLKRGGVK
jgi:hypothetical protein